MKTYINKFIILAFYLFLPLSSYATSNRRPGGGVEASTIGGLVFLIVVLTFGALYIIYASQKHEALKNDKVVLLSSILLYIFSIMLIIHSFSKIYQKTGIIVNSNSSTQQITTRKKDTLYFSVVTWTTLGFGDFVPTKEARKYAAIEALLGYIYMGLLVGITIKALTSSKPNDN